MSHESPISSAQAAKMRHKYVVGFVLSIVLTLIPFALVMLDSTASQVVVALLVIAMFAQVWVQLAFFLHLHSDREHRIYLLSFWYTFIAIFIFFVGSVWVLYHLHLNMM